MRDSIKSKIPLTFLICISLWWGFYYQSNSLLNDFGNANFEWLFLVDSLLVLPVICFVCIKDKKEALIKAMVLACLAVLIGSYIVPEQNKMVLHSLESLRYLALGAILLFEVIAMLTVYLAIRSALNRQQDPDIAIATPIQRYLGQSPLASLLSFETRMWTFALFAKKITPYSFKGDKHFSYHQKDGAKSNLLGFIMLIAFELPIMHLVLHFIWSPFAANIISLLTLFSLVFFVAEYRAVSRRPISLINDTLVIRYGLYQPLEIPISNIASIQGNNTFIKRSKYIKRYNYAGNANIKITLNVPIGSIKHVFVGVDNDAHFIAAIEAKLSN